MTDIKTIPTKHNGILFRSRLEARWSIFFDTLRIRWQYEPEGFSLSDGTGYVPDFYLPNFNGGIYVEVKPDGGDFRKAILFSIESSKRILFAEGHPDYRVYCIPEQVGRDTVFCPNCFDGRYSLPIPVGENRLFWDPGVGEFDENGNRLGDRDIGWFDFEMDHPTVLTDAIENARRARFW